MSKSLLTQYAELFDLDTGIFRFGEKFFPLRHIINAQKGGTFFVMFALMCYYNNFSLGAWVYLGLHGSYGILWVIKDYTFPDKAFQQKANLLTIFVTVVILLLYWCIGFMMMSGVANPNPSAERICFCIMLNVIGSNLMISSDIQKYVTLQHKKGLISDLMMETNRNPNFLGEMMLYSSFAFLVDNLNAFLILFLVWFSLFVSRIILKENSLAKKAGYAEYKNNSYLIINKIFKQDVLNFAVYGFMFCLTIFFYQNGGVENTIRKFKGN